MKKLAALLGIATVPLWAPQIWAHHSVAGQFDVDKTARLTGVVSKVDWINPHTYIFIDVKGQGGQVVTWKVESLPVAMMRKAGLSKQALLGTGQTIVADVHPARDGTQHLAYMIRMTYPDGRVVQFARDPNDPA